MPVNVVQLTPSPPDELSVALVVSRYNQEVTDRLQQGAIDEFRRRTGDHGTVVVIPAPGAYELTALCDAAARTGGFHAVVALGCIIKGETRHDEYLAHAVAQGLTDITLRTGVPVAFGVLTTLDDAQAEARAGGPMGNKGAEAMSAALETAGAIAAMSARTASGTARVPTMPSRPV